MHTKLKSILSVSLLFFHLCITNAQIQAYVQTCIFQNSVSKYVELYYVINSPNKNLQLDIFIYKSDTIIHAKKLKLYNQNIRASQNLVHIERIPLFEGNYEIKSIFNDGEKDEFSLINPIFVKSLDTNHPISEIQLCSSIKTSTDSTNLLYKNGFIYEPQMFNIYDPSDRLLQFYYETYSVTTDPDKQIIHHYIIEKLDTNGRRTQILEWFKKRTSKTYDPIIIIQDISNIPSGNFVLRIELTDKNKTILNKSEIGFIRYNPFWDKFINKYFEESESKRYFEKLSKDSANYTLKAILPNVPSIDMPIINFLNKSGSETEIKLYIYNYFLTISNKENCLQKYFEYMREAKQIDELFYSGFGRGFETDRGKIYLKYGKPSEIIPVDQDNGAYPYEIWIYNKIDKTNQSNAKLLFYNPDLAGSDFRLLHSTVRGERNNPRWEPELYKRAATEIIGTNTIDATRVQDNFHRRAREYFEN